MTAGTGWAGLAARQQGRALRLLVLVVAFILVFRLNQMTDYTADDFIYHYFYQAGTPNEGTRLLTGPLDIFGSLAVHYQVQNGRMLSHFIVQFFCLFDKTVFDVANTLVFLALGYLVLWHIHGRLRVTALQLVSVLGALWVFIPYFGQAALWLSGSVNYVWMAAVILLTLLPYRLHRPRQVPPRWMVPAMLVVGLVAGSTNENSGGAWLLMAGAFMLSWRAAGRRIPLWAWVGVVGAAVGLFLQLIAPGNRARAAKLGGGLDASNAAERFSYILKLAAETSGVLVAVFVLLMIVCLFRARAFTGDLPIAAAYAVAGLVSGFIMVVTPTMPHRSWIWSVVFLMVAIGLVARAWGAPDRVKHLALIAVVGVLLVWGGVQYVGASASIEETHREVARQLQVIEENKARGNLDVVVTKFRQPTNRYDALAYTGNLRDDPAASFNQWYAHYYGLRSITIDNPDQMYR